MTNKLPVAVKSVVTGLERGAEEKRPLGDRIRALRNLLGLSQTEFGELLGGLNRETVARWEKGRRPQHANFSRLVEVAIEHGDVQDLLGTDERKLMLASLQLQVPSEGALMFLEFAVDGPGDLSKVLAELCSLGAQPNKFVALDGDPDTPRKEALVLIHAPTLATMEAINDYVRDSKRLQDPHIAVRSNETFNVRIGEAS